MKHGRPSFAVMPAEEYERLSAAAEYLDSIEAIRSGLEAAEAGQSKRLLSGKNRSAFRILYQIKSDEVRVFAIRRPSQDLMEPDDHSE